MVTTEWRECKLDELGFVGRGKSRHRPRNDARLYGGPYPFIQTAEIMDADPYITGYSQTYTEFGLQQSKLWPPNTLCITIAGANTAETAILKFEACFPDSIVGFIPDEKKADLHFVKYSLDLMKDKFLAVTRGATQDNLSLDKLLSFPLRMPPLLIQRRIAGILSAYDELIENKQRRIKILEEMARSIYREWFVHFLFPGHDKVKMVPSPLGPIPQGWEVKNVKEVLARRPAGQVYREEDVVLEGTVPVIDQSTDALLGFHDNEPTHLATPESPIAIFGDHTCKMQLLVEPFSIGPNVVAFEANVDRPISYLFHIVRSLVQTQEYKRHWSQLTAKEIVLADKSTAEHFSTSIQPSLQQVEVLRKASRVLRRTRDLLLPRLLSGQVHLT